MDVLDDECPDFVAEAVGVEVALLPILAPPPTHNDGEIWAYLESHARLDLICKHLRNSLVEVRHNAHSKLGFDAAAADQVVERVCEGHSDAAFIIMLVRVLSMPLEAASVRCGPVVLVESLLRRHLRGNASPNAGDPLLEIMGVEIDKPSQMW